jgi:hypothetical protein
VLSALRACDELRASSTPKTCDELVPEWLNFFVDVVVDSENLRGVHA